MKSQGFPQSSDTVMIVLLLIFLFLVDLLQVDSVSQSMYTIVHHFMRISSEIFNFQKIYFQRKSVLERTDNFFYLIVAEKLLDPKWYR